MQGRNPDLAFSPQLFFFISDSLILFVSMFLALFISQLLGKDPDAGKDGGQEEKEATEDETVGWHHQLDGHEFEQARGDGKRQGSLACAVHGAAESWT